MVGRSQKPGRKGSYFEKDLKGYFVTLDRRGGNPKMKERASGTI